uniref:Uncharacterized protein n=1 Tax=viral metagenome TaxID=1070528 RepID=A0A6M3L639_9ZZZZ
MSTTLLASQQELSKQLGDYWSSTTTSAGASGGATVVDTALKAKQNDWITQETYDLITSGTYDGEERLVVDLDNTSGILSNLAHGGQIASAVTYELHRLFSASEKRRALIAAARQAYPNIFKTVRDESFVSGNWLKDGSFEVWTSSSALTYWTTATSTIAQTSTAYLFEHGAYSCKLSTAAGSIMQSVSNNDDLKRLAGKSVTFKLRGWCDTADCLRIAIYDGTDYTYSDYHDGDDVWTARNEPLEVVAKIGDNPSVIQFIIYHAVAAATSYVDDGRAMCAGTNPRIYIGNLGLAQNTPTQVLVEPVSYALTEPWLRVTGIVYDTSGGFMYLPENVSSDLRLRILGRGYLDFLASGVSSTAWTATIAIDNPQLDILVAQAAMNLYTEMSMPNFTQGTREKYMQMIGFWQQKYVERCNKFRMNAPSTTVNWGF